MIEDKYNRGRNIMENIIKKILEKENIKYNEFIKATSGFTNLVYFIDDEFVIKISKDAEVKKKLNKETAIYQNIKLPYIPKFIASGVIDDFQYLVITKLKGCSLYSIWHTLTAEERHSCVRQMAEILKAFNRQEYIFLDNEYKDFDWVGTMREGLMSKSITLNEMGFDTSDIDKFVLSTLSNLFSQNTFGLVYNDAHFDNFIYDGGKLSLIDFDRVRACPIDYEMLIFKTMTENPLKFASEEDEDKIKEEDYADIYKQFKNEYPEMFKGIDAERRISIYQFNYLMGQAIKCKDFQWINELLHGFSAQLKVN